MPSARPRMAAQDGFTLVELLVAVTLMGVILTASLAALTGVERGQREVGSRTDELATSRQAVERMTREIRSARAASATASSLTISALTYTPGVAKPAYNTVVYACSGTSCTRSLAGGTAKVVLSNVTNAGSVFTASADASGDVNYVTFTVTMATRGANKAAGSITLADGVEMRNVT